MSYNLYRTWGPASTVVQPTEASGGGPGMSTFESANPITTTSYTFTMKNSDPAGDVFEMAIQVWPVSA